MSKKVRKKKKSIKNTFAKNPIFWALFVVAICVLAGVWLTFGSNSSTPSANFEGTKLVGVDVSSHNGSIQWKVAKDNIDFAFIRVGYRGYGNGEIVQDKKAKYNLKNAIKNDVAVGVYFYSQAITEQEAIEEAEFAIDIAKKYNITLPIVIDFEYAEDSNGDYIGRLHDANLTVSQNTSIITAFCQTIEENGYKAGVYASSNVFKYLINTKQLSDDTLIWVAEYSDKLSYTDKFDVWQYTKTGSIDGISSKYVDINYWYIPEDDA